MEPNILICYYLKYVYIFDADGNCGRFYMEGETVKFEKYAKLATKDSPDFCFDPIVTTEYLSEYSLGEGAYSYVAKKYFDMPISITFKYVHATDIKPVNKFLLENNPNKEYQYPLVQS